MVNLKDGEFYFKSIVAGNTIVLYGRCDFNHNEKKWIAKIEGQKLIGKGDSSDIAIIDIMKQFMK